MQEGLAMLLKTNGDKMPDDRSLAMSMKPNDLESPSGDVDETKGDGSSGLLIMNYEILL
jgi:hypothetical protein